MSSSAKLSPRGFPESPKYRLPQESNTNTTDRFAPRGLIALRQQLLGFFLLSGAQIVYPKGCLEFGPSRLLLTGAKER